MDSALKKELKLIEKRKLKAQKEGDLVEEAKLCNHAGELLSQYGFFDKAAHEHKLEVQLSEAAQDKIGAAVAHRKVGECLCEMGKYKEALFHQNLHLELAKSTRNLVEEQRALATIGRTWFVCSDTAADKEEVEECLLQAQLSYRNSLSVCDKLHDIVADKELLEMRSRLFLNLGLVYESSDYSLAQKFIEKAVAIARDQGLSDTEFRCCYALGSVLVKKGQDANALRNFKLALEVARKHNKKFDEADALTQLGQIFLKLGEFSAARRTLKKAYKIAKARRSDDFENLRTNLVTAIKGIKLQQKYEQFDSYSEEEQIKILDNLGDVFSQGKAFNKAISCYRKELELAKSCGKSSKDLSAIYVSIAITLGDLKRYSETLQCYEEELEALGDNYKEKCDTWCNIAYVHELAGHEYKEVEEAYQNALDFAVKADKPSFQLRVYKALADTQKKYEEMKLYHETQSKILELETNHGMTQDDSESEVDGEECKDEGEDDQVLLEKELQLSESEEEDDEDGETHSVSVASRRQYRTNRSKLKKLNERGETPLHQAAIAGDSTRVKKLLEKGADINARDYCGWQPLHEACNHGHEDVVNILLDHGAKVNDRGGTHCRGVTPLHDAAVNGHLGVVQMLVEHGASLSIRDDDGRTALDAVIVALKNEDDDLENSEGSIESEIAVGCQRVKKFLHSVKTNQRIEPPSEMRRCNQLEIHRDQNDLFSQFNRKLHEREQNRNRKKSSLGRDSTQNHARNLDQHGFNYTKRQNTENLDNSQIVIPMACHLTEGSASIEDTLGSNPVDREDNSSYTNENTRTDLEEYDSTYSSMDEERPEIDDDLPNDFGNGLERRSNTSLTFVDSVTGEITAPSRSNKSLIMEGDPSCKGCCGEDNWLVDDMPHKSSKRKRTAKQITLTGRIAGTTKRTSNRTKSRSFSSHRQKQTGNRQALLRKTNFDASPMIEIFNNNEVESESSIAPTVQSQFQAGVQITSRQNPVAEVAQTAAPVFGPPPMRLQVKIQDKAYLIPCPLGSERESKTVAWLADQASLRYYSANGSRPVLTLQTSYGALLSAEDLITDVLSNNEEVIATIQSWDLKPLIDRYKAACINLSTDTRRDISQVLESEPQITDLVLLNAMLCAKHALPLFKALQRHDGLVKLTLSGNKLGDLGVQYLATAIPTLPGLAILNLQANGITHVGLSHLASSFATARQSNNQDADEVKLEELCLGYNDIGDSVCDPLSRVVENCQRLSKLELESCMLTCKTFETTKRFARALKDSGSLQHLILSRNELGPVGISDVLHSLTPCIRHLDMYSTAADKRSREVPDYFKAFMDKEDSCLQTLNLGDCNIDDTSLEKLVQSKGAQLRLQSLDLSCNDITSVGITSFSRCVFKQLTSLNLAGNTALCNDGFLNVLKALGTMLHELNVSACGLSSPMSETILAEIKLLLQNDETPNLHKIDLSHNLLELNDKNELADAWNSLCKEESTTNIDEQMCVLCRVVT